MPSAPTKPSEKRPNRVALFWAWTGLVLWIPGCALPAIAIKTWFWGIEQPVSLLYGLKMLWDKNVILAMIVALLGLGTPMFKWWTLFREARGRDVHWFHGWVAKFASLEIVAAAFLLVCAKFGTAGGDAFALPGLYFLIAAWCCGVASSFVLKQAEHADEPAIDTAGAKQAVRAATGGFRRFLRSAWGRSALIAAGIGLLVGGVAFWLE